MLIYLVIFWIFIKLPLKPNFDTLTLVGVKKSRNSADFSVSD